MLLCLEDISLDDIYFLFDMFKYFVSFLISLYLFKMIVKANNIQNTHFRKQTLRDIDLGHIQIH